MSYEPYVVLVNKSLAIKILKWHSLKLFTHFVSAQEVVST